MFIHLIFKKVIGYFSGYRRPKNKIAEWMRRGDLVSPKRGLYVVGPTWREGEYGFCRLDLPPLSSRPTGEISCSHHPLRERHPRGHEISRFASK
jgi:hypothetical protein